VQHRIALYSHKAYFAVRFVRLFVYFLCCRFVLLCAKNAKNTLTKHRKTPQNTAKHRKTLFLKNIHNHPAT